MAYMLFKHKNILPGTYYGLPAGEKLLLWAFMTKE